MPQQNCSESSTTAASAPTRSRTTCTRAPGISRRRFGDRLHNAGRDGKLMHELAHGANHGTTENGTVDSRTPGGAKLNWPVRGSQVRSSAFSLAPFTRIATSSTLP